MEGDDESGAAAEAALGLSPQLFVNEALNMVDDVRREAFEYCLQEGVPEAVGAAAATQRAQELERGVNDIHLLVKDVLDKKMSSWEKYCLRHCFTVPEGFMAPEDDNSSANESHKDGNCDSDLDAELDSLRRKLENANKESEELQREISSVERQTTYKRNLNSSIAEVLKLFEDKSVQDNIQDLVNAIPKLHEKMKGMKRKRAEIESTVSQNVWNVNGLRDKKRLALSFTASTEDIQEVVNVLRKE